MFSSSFHDMGSPGISFIQVSQHLRYMRFVNALNAENSEIVYSIRSLEGVGMINKQTDLLVVSLNIPNK